MKFIRLLLGEDYVTFLVGELHTQGRSTVFAIPIDTMDIDLSVVSFQVNHKQHKSLRKYSIIYHLVELSSWTILNKMITRFH